MNPKIKNLLDELDISPKDKVRLLQCAFCQQDPAICGCDENNEDEYGLCKNYIGQLVFVPKGE